MSFRVEYLRSPDGTGIAAARGGTGPTLVVCPAWGQSVEELWQHYAPGFPDHELVTWDRRGSGLSDRGGCCTDPAAYLTDAQAVVDHFGLDQFAVLGTLLGGVEAAWLACENPERVSQVVLRAPVTNPADWAALPFVAAGLAAMEHSWEFFTEAFAQSALGWGQAGGPELAAQWRQAIDRDDLRAFVDAFVTIDLADLYPAIGAPTLVEHHPNYFFPASYSRDIASSIPNCELAVFAGNVFHNDFSIPQEFLGRGSASGPLETIGPTTILFTDIESSTALTQALGDLAAQELLAEHDEAVRSCVAQFGGREVKHTGDGIMAAFGSATAAVRAAIAMQEQLDGARIRVRIGLNAGEPVQQGRDLFGTAVQLAARITDLADPGTVYASGVVRDLCAGKDLTFESAGSHHLKGFTESTQIYKATGPHTA